MVRRLCGSAYRCGPLPGRTGSSPDPYPPGGILSSRTGTPPPGHSSCPVRCPHKTDLFHCQIPAPVIYSCGTGPALPTQQSCSLTTHSTTLLQAFYVRFLKFYLILYRIYSTTFTVTFPHTTTSPAKSFFPRCSSVFPFTCTVPSWIRYFASTPDSAIPAALSAEFNLYCFHFFSCPYVISCFSFSAIRFADAFLSVFCISNE